MSYHKHGQFFLRLFAICLAAILAYHQYQAVLADPHRCGKLATEGAWSQRPSNASPATDAHWQPSGCMLRRYSASDVGTCTYWGKSILFVGDSMIRQVFWATASKLNKTRARQMRSSAPKHQNLVFEHSHGPSPEHHNSTLRFIWDPYLNLTDVAQTYSERGSWLSHIIHNTSERILVVGAGLWHARHLNNSYLDEFSRNTHRLEALSRRNMTIENRASDEHHYRLPSMEMSTAVIPVLNPYQPNLSEDRATSITPERIRELNLHLYHMQQDHNLNVFWSFLRMTKDLSWAYEADGIHVTDAVALARADVLLNYYCNRFLSGASPHTVSCCNETSSLNPIQFGLILFAGVVTVVGFVIPITGYKHLTKSIGVTSLHVAEIAHSAAVLASALLYCFVADRTKFFDKVAKDTNLFNSVTLSGVSLLCGLSSITIARQDEQSLLGTEMPRAIVGSRILSREQTEEWKGWMQILVLLYHYFGMSKVLWVYQVIRLLVASYLFMTGYGHTMYFLKTGDFSLRRFTNVLFRLNILSCLLSYVMDTEYDFYYFPALCSFWFVVVFGTLWRTGPSVSKQIFAARILTSALLVSTLILCPRILENISLALHMLCRLKLNAHEFRFRVSLDLFIVYFGMILAFLHVKTQHQIDSGRHVGLSKCCFVLQPRLLVPICVAVLGLYAWFARSSLNKYASNRIHPMSSPFAVLAFIGLRNASPKLRASYSRLFAWIGRFSLETFILQYHVWLAGDTKGLLHIPGFDRIQMPLNTITLAHVYWLHFTVVTIYFVLLSCKLSQAINVLTARFAGSQKVSAVQQRRVTKSSEEKVGSRGLKQTIARVFSSDLRNRVILVLLLSWTLNWLW